MLRGAIAPGGGNGKGFIMDLRSALELEPWGLSCLLDEAGARLDGGGSWLDEGGSRLDEGREWRCPRDSLSECEVLGVCDIELAAASPDAAKFINWWAVSVTSAVACAP